MPHAAAADPAGFRLLFHHAAREPEFRAAVDGIRRVLTGIVAAASTPSTVVESAP